MRNFLRYCYRAVRANGLDLRILIYALRGIVPFVRDASRYYRTTPDDHSMRVQISGLLPILADRYAPAGTASGHYFFQDLWAAKKVYERKPKRHVDIGSSIEGFIAHLLVFMDFVEVIDVRPLQSTLSNLHFTQDDATLLTKYPDSSIESISTLHAAEHFGLGRYGDPVDPLAHEKFMRALVRVLKPGGRLYFSVPTGIERLEFNAHRIFSPATIIKGLDGLELLEFNLVKDNGVLYENADFAEACQQGFGCGLYEFTKKPVE